MVAQWGEGLRHHASVALDGPFMVLFGQQGADRADDGIDVEEDADGSGAALDLADSNDPVKNGTLVRSVNERSYGD